MTRREWIVAWMGAWLVALSWLAPAQAQRRASQAQVRAYLSANVVRLGDKVALVVTVENAQKARLGALPQVSGLSLGPVGEPSQRTYMEMINGRTTRSVSSTWGIALRPADVGEYVIPPFEVIVDDAPVATTELRLNVVADMRGEDLGFLELRTSSKKVIVGQPFSLELVFGFDAAIADKTTYGNLALSWWGNLPGLLENQAPAAGSGRKLEIYLNERQPIEVEQVESRQIRGREFIALRLVRSFTPTREGRIDIPTSFFEFGSVVERRDFFQTRREKGETFFARAPELAIDVVPLPEAGRPTDYSGAIGNFGVRADATPRDVDAGESIKLELTYTGEGNLEFFTAPDIARLDAFRDFRVYGKTERRSFDRRVVVYDLAPVTSAVQAIPAVPLSIYDPQTERYGTLQTDPIPISVRALQGVSGLAGDESEDFARDLRDVELAPGPQPAAQALGAAWLLGLLASVPTAWLVLRTWARRHFDPDAPAERARRRARKELARRLQRAGDARGQLDCLHDFLAARTATRREAWIGQRLSEVLRGVDPKRVQGLEGVIADLEAAVWGGRASSVSSAVVLSAVDEALGGGL